MSVRKVSNSKINLQGYWRSLHDIGAILSVSYSFDMPV